MNDHPSRSASHPREASHHHYHYHLQEARDEYERQFRRWPLTLSFFMCLAPFRVFTNSNSPSRTIRDVVTPFKPPLFAGKSHMRLWGSLCRTFCLSLLVVNLRGLTSGYYH